MPSKPLASDVYPQITTSLDKEKNRSIIDVVRCDVCGETVNKKFAFSINNSTQCATCLGVSIPKLIAYRNKEDKVVTK
jgi:formylmethanofuran dehydrogenase subunit E